MRCNIILFGCLLFFGGVAGWAGFGIWEAKEGGGVFSTLTSIMAHRMGLKTRVVGLL